MLTGYDNRFGHNREEGFDDYVRYGEELGIKVLALPAKGSISSSHIRQLLAQGYVSEAAECLGHPYSICGQVTHGEHIGTQLGFPTANIKTAESSQLIPLAGVYAVRVQLERDKELRKGMMNIGTRPTFGEHLQTLEVHVLDYEGNLYGQSIKVEFIRRLREERHFDKPEALIEQLKKDAIEAQQQT